MMENPGCVKLDGEFKDKSLILAECMAASEMSTFEMTDIKVPKKPKFKFQHFFIFAYLMLLTGGFVYLAYRDMSLHKEFAAFTAGFCHRKCPDKPQGSETLIGEREDPIPDSEDTGLAHTQDRSVEKKGTEWLRNLEDDIRLIQVKNMELTLRVNNITLLPGAPGLNGKPGDRGPPGTPGSKGEKGEAGLSGKKGDDGISRVGPPGAMGPPGLSGQNGMKGDPGRPGQDGQKGATGAPGVSGLHGLPGAPGQKGNKGDIGVTGTPGAAGTPGTDGQMGQKGDTGGKGEPGRPGQDGLKGSVGASGIPGIQGASGQKGDKGDNGATGMSGPAGAPGIGGQKGQKGDTGSKGDVGAKGDRGIPGSPGLNGIKGESGTPGLPGQRGQPGQKGDPGPQGPRGDLVGSNLVQIVGGSRGRVEIMRNGQWGTICDDDWDINDGKVICRMLGYSRIVSAFTAGGGTGKILLDNMKCTGNEQSIYECPKSGWEEHNCNHAEDAGVECA